jgi:hypothetical protein
MRHRLCDREFVIAGIVIRRPHAPLKLRKINPYEVFLQSSELGLVRAVDVRVREVPAMKIYLLVLLLGAITAFAHLSWKAEQRQHPTK